MIAAMDKNHLIGDGDKIPWHIPEDFKYFKRMTLGKPIIMGRSTFESIHSMKGTNPSSGVALPKRDNIIITRDVNYKTVDCTVWHSINSALEFIKNSTDEEIMVIGGGTIYKQFLQHADRLYITEIDGDYTGDTYFPKWSNEEWTLSSSTPQNGFTFKIYDRIKS